MIKQIVKFDVKPEFIHEFKAALIEDKKGAQLEAGFIEMSLFQDKQQPSVFFGYERWQDRAALDAHMQEPHTEKVIALVETALQTPVEVMDLSDCNPAPLHDLNPKNANPEDELFIIFFIFKIKEGYRDKLLNQFETHVASTRREEEGNILFDLYTVDGKEDTLAVYEHWRKESDVWDIHFNQSYAIETGKLMHQAVVGDLEQYMNFVVEFGE